MVRLTEKTQKMAAGLAVAVFVVAFLVFLGLAGFGFMASLFLAALIALLLGIILYICLCLPGAAPTPKTASPPEVGETQAAADAKAAEDSKAARAAEAARQAKAEEARKAAEDEVRHAAEEAAATAATAAAPISAGAAPQVEDNDREVAAEGSDDGARPSGLDAPRDGAADDLKQIKGIGPKLEKLCNSLGFWHFDQIAAWTADEVAWVDANLTGFKGRVSRDEWVEQARVLAAGGETEFSKRVEDGDVY